MDKTRTNVLQKGFGMTTFKVIVTKQQDDRYTARALLFPDIVSSGADETEAISQLRKVLADVQARSHVVEVDLPGSATNGEDPWLPFIGMWEHDPDWDMFEAEVAAYRAEIDARFAPE